MTLVWVTIGAAALVAGWWIGMRFAMRRAAHRAEPELAEVRSELTRRLNELFSLQELTYVLADSIQADRIAEQVSHFVERFIPCDGAAVVLSGDPPDRVRVLAAGGSLERLQGTEADAGSGPGIVAAAMAEEQLKTAEGVGSDAPPVMGDVGARQAAAVPLRAHGMTVGAIAVAKDSTEPYAEEDLRLLSTVATHAAMAFANARFFALVHSGKLQWETTFDALADGVAVVDETGRIRRANRALAVMMGTRLPELIGLDLGAALAGGASTELADLIVKAREGSRPAPLTFRSTTLNRILRVGASLVSAEVAPGWVATLIEDVTEQKALEAQLVQSEKMAAVGQLVSGVAHELNNPLTSISGLSEFLLQHPEPGERDRDHIRVIHEQAERAAKIVGDLLAFARKGPTDVEDVDVNEVVERALSLIGYELRLRDVQLETDFASKLPPVRGDRHQIQQVVLNLLTNAVQAMSELPAGEPRRLRVTTARDGNQAVLRVADSGPGIPEELQPRIFDPFVTTKAPGKGTGLGLSITYRIVEDHGGKITADRGPKGGALFTVTLPVGRPTPQPSRSGRADAGVASAGGGRRILLMDDDPAVRRMIDALFAQDGEDVESAPDAKQAIELLSRNRYDLIIADARAAVSAGESFATVLHSQFPELAARTILLTADVRPETDEWLSGLGCRYFRKPFNVRELRAAAAEMMR